RHLNLHDIPRRTTRIPTMRRLALAFSLALFPIAASSAIPAQAETANGMIEGAPGRGDGMMVYKGIPFAAPPTGDNRWRAPQPVTPWDGVRDATEFGPRCMQPGTAEGLETSEDCLYLNVWTPAENAD